MPKENLIDRGKCMVEIPTYNEDGTKKDSDYWVMCLKPRPCPIHDKEENLIDRVLEEFDKEFVSPIISNKKYFWVEDPAVNEVKNFIKQTIQKELKKIEERVEDFDLSLAHCNNIDDVLLLSDDVFKDYK